MGYFFELCELMPVVFFEHALGTHELMANTAEVLDLFVLMLETEHAVDVCHL